jgi:hypothetical protein
MVFETCVVVCVIDARRRRADGKRAERLSKACILALLHAEPSFFVICRYGLSGN